MGYERRKDPRAVRRIVLGFGLGFLFAGGLFIPLLIIWDRSSPPPLPVLMSVAVSMAVVAPILIFSAFSWALFYRCPQCKQRVKRLKREPLMSVSVIVFNLSKLAPVDVAKSQRSFNGTIAVRLSVYGEASDFDKPIGDLIHAQICVGIKIDGDWGREPAHWLVAVAG